MIYEANGWQVVVQFKRRGRVYGFRRRPWEQWVSLARFFSMPEAEFDAAVKEARAKRA